MISLHLDAVRPDPLACPALEEYRLLAALAPLRVRLDQNVLAFLKAFWGAVAATLAAAGGPPGTSAAGEGSGDGCGGLEGDGLQGPLQPDFAPFFQKVEVGGCGGLEGACVLVLDSAALVCAHVHMLAAAAQPAFCTSCGWLSVGAQAY
jgi:hypothetical protein